MELYLVGDGVWSHFIASNDLLIHRLAEMRIQPGNRINEKLVSFSNKANNIITLRFSTLLLYYVQNGICRFRKD
jgi:hypothetical protein